MDDTNNNITQRSLAHEVCNVLVNLKFHNQALNKLLRAKNNNLHCINEASYAQFIEHTDGIEQSIQQVVAIIRNSSKIEEPRELFSAVSHLKKLVSLMADPRLEQALTCKFEQDANLYGCKIKFSQLLTNLMNNALDATEPVKRKAQITLTAYKREGQFIISIKDNGVGITEAQKRIIFQPGVSFKSKGQGLGLNLCQNIVKRFNGKITIDSKPDEYTQILLIFKT